MIMNRPVLLPNGQLRVPAAELDSKVGIAHVEREIGPDHPDYAQLRQLAIPASNGTTATPDPATSAERDSRQAELDHYLRAHRREGDAMLHVLERMVSASDRRAS
ncbi:hypothetical protein ACFY4C_39565 [Actinomadura viridis]|uniref:hypothetical protein n=1 Tax=Actinomadura viridis TaxID=58110 RepID=UPI0036863D55